MVDFALFWIFCVFIQFLFFVRSISGDNYMRYIVQQEVWSACFQREPWFASQKNHHSTGRVLYSMPFNSLICLWGFYLQCRSPAMVRLYCCLNASFCCLIDWRSAALSAVTVWNGFSLICLSAFLSQ